MRYIIIFIIVWALPVYPQNYSSEWLNDNLNLNEKDFFDYFTETKNLDFSDIWLNEDHQDHFIGFIGKNHQRIYLHFYTIIKNRNNNIQYYVRGGTKVKEYIKIFLGNFNILHSKLYTTKDDSVKRGFTIASYEFFEIPRLVKSGSYAGITKLNWYINSNGELCYDNLDFEEDDYSSNCGFVGIWKEYNSETELICNFGQYRIPYAFDLDVGVGEFIPAEEFRNNDWEDFFIYTDGEDPAVKWWREY